MRSVDAIIPALNEVATIGGVVQRLYQRGIRKVWVVDNGSSDETSSRASDAGAHVIYEPKRGYGAACLAGLGVLSDDPPEWVLFCDADGSDDPEGIAHLLSFTDSEYGALLTHRAPHLNEHGALTIPQRFGNRLACFLIDQIHGVRFQDLGPLRMLRYDCLTELNMRDTDFGWTVEMQLKLAKTNAKWMELDVKARRRRGGKSKISGTVKGTVLAGYVIIKTIFRDGR